MITLDDISIVFAKNSSLEKKLFNNFNMKIYEGDFISVIGNNGAGKSTLLRMLAGTVKPDSGKIFIDNEDITKNSVDQRSESIARVFQDPKLGTCANLTIAENMSLAYQRGKTRNLSLALNKSKVEFFKEQLVQLEMGLENRINEQVSSLSGGQRQALSLLMAVLSPAKLLLLDEHTAALDPKMANSIMELTNKLYRQHNLTILMVTHDIKQAFAYGNRTIMLQSGKIKSDLQGKARKDIDPISLLSEY